MKPVLLILALLLSVPSFASQAPYSTEVENRFNTIEADSWVTSARINALAVTTAKIAAGNVTEAKLEAPTGAGLYVERVARIVWDPSGVAGDRTVASHASGVTIPANAVIRQVWFFTKTSLVSTGNNGTIAVQCNAANDVFSAADIDASTGVAGSIGAGVEIGTAATMLKVTTACDITFVVGTNAFTAGKMDWFIAYDIAE